METTLIMLGYIDIDLALREEQPAPLTVESTPNVKRDFERSKKRKGAHYGDVPYYFKI
ncbi:hypothetical protein PVK06_005625 [Gossypium arboreum]|uniref:Uncharacterized protein n=1 Tax=Gossypium arboreum TaxID=29729 RepID=A0ABR0QV19_GOSAR|nr:hypothetical protein PVK06_005625 [Gossypium arboreum]